MSQNMSIAILTILIVAAGFYFMQGGFFSKQNFDIGAYQAMCEKYKTADPGVYKKEEMQMLVNEINYLISDEIENIKDPATKQLKQCAQALSGKLN